MLVADTIGANLSWRMLVAETIGANLSWRMLVADSISANLFSSGREGTHASIKIQLQFQIKELSEVMLGRHLFLKVFYVYLSKMYTETAEISKKEDCEFCTCGLHTK